MSSRRFTRPFTVLLMIWLPACYSWQSTSVSDIPRDTVRLRVTMLDERRLDVTADRITTDSILGRGRPLLLQQGGWFGSGEWRPVSLALADIKRTEKQVVSAPKTGLAVMSALLATVLTVAGVAFAKMGQ